MPFAKIVLLAVLGSVAYGLVHDQVTVRVSLEYFTIGHPRVLDTEDPTTLALTWGVVATWWVGAILGLLWAIAARAGRRPPLSASAFARPALLLFLSAAALALAAGFVGRALAERGAVVLLEPLASLVPRERHVAFLTALWAHSASYGAGALGGIVVAIWAWKRRGRADPAPSPAAAPAAHPPA